MKRLNFLLILFVLIIFSCSKQSNTATKKFQLTGKINFYSIAHKLNLDKKTIGTIKLFKPTSVVDSMNIFKGNYSFVGSSINPILGLDYRKLGEPIYEVKTNSLGEFSISKVISDKYLLVYSAEGFGWHIKAINVNQNLELELSMTEKRLLPISIEEDLTIGPNEFVELTSDFSILNNATLRIKENTVFVLSNCKISVIGNLNIEGTNEEPVIFTSAQSTPDYGDWDRITFTSSSTSSISGVIFMWAFLPLEFFSASEANNVIITNSKYYSIYIENISLNLAKITFYNNEYGCYISGQTELENNTLINKSLFLNTHQTAIYIQTASPIIKNSIFFNSDIHINAYWDSFPIISYSIFSNDKTYSITSSKRDNISKKISISFSEFENSNTIFYFNRGSFANITNNNLFTPKNYTIKLNYYYGGNEINAQNNWWGTSNEDEIQNLIWDSNDTTNENDPGTVDYSHWKNSKIENTGPRND